MDTPPRTAVPRWVPIAEELPPHDLPVSLWGTKLERGVDHPLTGRLCGCHDQWVLDSDPEVVDDDGATAAHTERMLGDVTHWLDWRPGP